jgi:GTP cyclohydrolase II
MRAVPRRGQRNAPLKGRRIPQDAVGTGEALRVLEARAKTMSIAATGGLWRIASTRMPTRWGMFEAIGFERDVWDGTSRVETALAIVMGDVTEGVPLLRIHSQCFTGEVLGSLRCDCGDQLEMAMQAIAEQGRGLVIYEYQEGRGIGLMAKLEAYDLQDAGLDTVEANHALGFKADCRDFGLPAAILRELRIRRVRLLTNNPRKVSALVENGIEVVARLACEAVPHQHALAYLRTKQERMGHALSLRQTDGTDRRSDPTSPRPSNRPRPRTLVNDRYELRQYRCIGVEP